MADQAQLLDEDDDEGIAQINVIPFVDISLVLLIIFLLTSNIIARGAFPVDLPKAANAGEAVESTLNIVLDAEGALFLDGKPVTRDELGAAVAKVAQGDPKVRAVIAADKAVRYELLVDVIDLVKESGVSAFALNVERAVRQ